MLGDEEEQSLCSVSIDVHLCHLMDYCPSLHIIVLSLANLECLRFQLLHAADVFLRTASSSTPVLFVLAMQVTAHPLVHHILLLIFRLFLLLLSSSTSRAYIRVVALFDYVARTDRELTFRAGDIMMITEMLSDDWSVPPDSCTLGCL